jgi:hypothetical protein
MEDEVEMDGLADDCRDYQIIVQLHKQAGWGPPISHSSIFNWFLRQVEQASFGIADGVGQPCTHGGHFKKTYICFVLLSYFQLRSNSITPLCVCLYVCVSQVIEHWSIQRVRVDDVYSVVQLGPNPFWSEQC